MNAERLLAHYETIAEAPDAIARLRRFVLDLAVRGKLVRQDPDDEPASELLSLVAMEAVDQDELPKGWCRARVGLLLEFQYGKAMKASERYADGLVPVFGSNGVVGFTDKALTQRPAIIVGRKGSAGALNLCDGPSWTTDVAYFIEPPAFMDLRFLLSALRTLNLGRLGKGVKPGLSRSDAYGQILRIPPLAEQKRIVAKVVELMKLCDRLDAAREKREATRDRLTVASLGRLSKPNPKTFQADAQFVLGTLPDLTTRPEQIKALRQTILNLAVRGRLVQQLAADGTAAELLRSIVVLKGGDGPTDEEVSERSKDAPFEIPSSWRWVETRWIAGRISDGVHKTPHYVSEGVPFLTVKNLTEGSGISFRSTKFISLADHLEYCKRTNPEAGDVLITKDGTIGVARVIDTDRAFSIFVSLALVKMAERRIGHFFALCLNSELIRETIIPKGAALKHLHLVDLRALMVPLPPLAEAARIVAKVDELMAVCDQLDTSIADAADSGGRLLDALLAGAFGAADDVAA